MYNNWYAVQVRSGHEEMIERTCEILVGHDYYKECFIPKTKKMKKFKGKWVFKEEILFKGYIFMISDHVDELFNELKKVPDLTKVLGKKDDIIFPIYKEEVKYLMKFGGVEHIVDVSSGYIEGDTVHVTEGPLIGQEGNIRKIDRHKRIAYVDVSLFGQVTTVQVGLEIISKS